MVRRRQTPFVFPKLEVPRRSEIVARRLAEAIHVGDVAVGEKLPSEAMLSEQLGVSRSVLRDALKLLAALTLIRIEPGAAGGAFVAASPTEWVPSALRLADFERMDMAEVLLARRVIEPPIVELAAIEARESDLAAMAATLSFPRALGPIPKRDASEEQVECLLLTAARFNVALGRATHNRVMMQIMDILIRAMEPVRLIAVRQAPREALTTLEATFQAVAQRDAVLIRKSIETRFRHLESAWERASQRRLPTHYSGQGDRVPGAAD